MSISPFHPVGVHNVKLGAMMHPAEGMAHLVFQHALFLALVGIDKHLSLCNISTYLFGINTRGCNVFGIDPRVRERNDNFSMPRGSTIKRFIHRDTTKSITEHLPIFNSSTDTMECYFCGGAHSNPRILMPLGLLDWGTQGKGVVNGYITHINKRIIGVGKTAEK